MPQQPAGTVQRIRDVAMSFIDGHPFVDQGVSNFTSQLGRDLHTLASYATSAGGFNLKDGRVQDPSSHRDGKREGQGRPGNRTAAEKFGQGV